MIVNYLVKYVLIGAVVAVLYGIIHTDEFEGSDWSTPVVMVIAAVILWPLALVLLLIDAARLLLRR